MLLIKYEPWNWKGKRENCKVSYLVFILFYFIYLFFFLNKILKKYGIMEHFQGIVKFQFLAKMMVFW